MRLRAWFASLSFSERKDSMGVAPSRRICWTPVTDEMLSNPPCASAAWNAVAPIMSPPFLPTKASEPVAISPW
jgi:hypothetical protein